jgi:hypothetical protein
MTIAPEYEVSPRHQRRGFDHNISGDLLTEYVAIRDQLSLNWGEGNGGANAYVKYDQAAEVQRFFNKRKAVFIIGLTDYEQDAHERVWLAEFVEEPTALPIAAGREDYFSVRALLQESAFA